jgi:excisionase family DNA binding protein
MSESVKVPKLLTPKEVAQRTGLQVWRVYQLIAEGLPAMRIGRTFRISETALAAWIEEQSQRREAT